MPTRPRHGPCSILFCEGQAVVKGLCWGHYKRTRTGSPMGVPLSVKAGGTISSAVRYGCRMHTPAEKALALMEWNLREGSVTPEPNTGCLIWTGLFNKSTGYGMVGSCKSPWGRYAHRAALWLVGAALPSGDMKMHVRHICNNPACVLVDHLRLGTAKENMADREARRGRGEIYASHSRKLV
jgi:hypothetical protein